MEDRSSKPHSAHQSFSRFTHRTTLRLLLVFGAVLTLSCALLNGVSTQLAPTPSEPVDTQIPPATEVAATLPPVLTETPEPSPPPPTVTPTVSVWETISGTWSGCLVSKPSSGLNDLVACTEPVGSFVTLYLLPSCDLGQLCGNYIKGTFDSEYILFKLTLNEIQGAQAWMYGDAGTGMFSWASTDLVIERSVDELILTEASGEGFVLFPGCDPVIQQYVTVGCFEQIQ